MFQVPKKAEELKWPYADPVSLVAAIRAGREVREAIARQWISEGVPFAFDHCPMLYEYIRCWLSRELDVPAKSIALTGSGSLGTSLVPAKFGQAFNSQSDLDWFIVSKSLFKKLRHDFNQWSDDYNSERVLPRSDRECAYWSENFSHVPRNIRNGFLSADRIPNRQQYSTARKVNNLMSVLKKKCERNPAAPDFRKASIRCYKDWKSAINQLSLNLKVVANQK